MSPQTASRLRRAIGRLASSPQELEAVELKAACRPLGATPVAEVVERERVTVAGTLRCVTLRPRAGVPALVAELYDGSGTVALTWLGRRQIPGIACGRGIVASGLVTRDDGTLVIFNPRYQLRPAGGSE